MTYVYYGMEMYRRAIFQCNVASSDPDLRHIYLVNRDPKYGIEIKIHLPSVVELDTEYSIAPCKPMNYYSPPEMVTHRENGIDNT